MKKVITYLGVVGAVALVSTSCTKDPDSPGLEYMPDMYRSPALEAYVDYGEVRNEDHPEWRVLQSSKTPPAGTVPYYADMEQARLNMPLPFKAPYLSDKSHNLYGWEMYGSPEEETEARETVIKNFKNPLPYSDAAMEEGAVLYNRMCAICHGEDGGGQGPIAASGKITGVANLTAPPNAGDSDGLLFYYMTYGKGVMGAHGMLLTREERWKIVLHLRALQNGGTYPTDAPENAVVEVVDLGEGIWMEGETVYVDATVSQEGMDALLAHLAEYEGNITIAVAPEAEDMEAGMASVEQVRGYLIENGMAEDRVSIAEPALEEAPEEHEDVAHDGGHGE